jgi:para-nitrobenzyl esterase
MTARPAMLALSFALAGCSQAPSSDRPPMDSGVPRSVGANAPEAGAPLGDGSAALGDASAALVDAGAGSDLAEPSCPLATPNDAFTVATTRGLVKGAQGNGLLSFLGIPFVTAPVGDLRWRPPVEHACWSGTLMATSYGSECVQKNVITGAVEGNEDCLYLNVWTPGIAGKAPVLFFVHGGANVLGSANQPVLGGNQYDGAALAMREHAVVVSANYRLGPLGFLAHPALEDGASASGNYAIYDQLAALRWVQRNIASFGGDPARVMLFGESAGAMNTCVLVATPLAKRLFASALMESGGCETVTKAAAETSGVKFAELKLGCFSHGDASCLRGLSANAIVAATDAFSLSPAAVANFDPSLGLAGSLPWVANVDGALITDTPLATIAAGKHNHVPFAIGSNSEEAGLFLASTTIATCQQYEMNIRMMFGASADDVIAHYPCSAYATPKAAEIDAATDLFFTCGTRRAARAAAAHQVAPVFRYYFSHRTSSILGSGAFHSAEIPYVFDTFSAVGSLPSAAETMLSQMMQDYWGNLAGDGTPGATAGVAWPVYMPLVETTLVLDTPASTKTQLKSVNCDFWDQLGGF